jgi:RNA polymerase sigma-70 factor (ECF subfamily)
MCAVIRLERRSSVLENVYELFIEGDAEAMSTLVEAYKNELYNFCYRLTWSRHDADDLFQQTWVKAVKNAPKYRNDNFRPWLYKIALNQFRDNRRQAARRRKHVAEEFGSTSAKDFIMTRAASGETTEEQYERKHIQALLIANIHKLPERLKVPVVLYYYEHMKYSQIAIAINVPEGTVKSRISAAKKRLKAELESELYV